MMVLWWKSTALATSAHYCMVAPGSTPSTSTASVASRALSHTSLYTLLRQYRCWLSHVHHMDNSHIPKDFLYSHLALCKNSKLHIAIVPAHMQEGHGGPGDQLWVLKDLTINCPKRRNTLKQHLKFRHIPESSRRQPSLQKAMRLHRQSLDLTSTNTAKQIIFSANKWQFFLFSCYYFKSKFALISCTFTALTALKTIFCQLFKVNEDISPMFPSKASWQWKLVSLPFFCISYDQALPTRGTTLGLWFGDCFGHTIIDKIQAVSSLS